MGVGRGHPDLGVAYLGVNATPHKPSSTSTYGKFGTVMVNGPCL